VLSPSSAPFDILQFDLKHIEDSPLVKCGALTPKDSLELRRTLTLDNGKEFSRFKELEIRTGLNVFFAEPYAAWQRGTNENTNGLLRFYFPKGTRFRHLSETSLARAVERLNNRPRKCLGYRTPQEVFNEARNGALAN
jgi:IS30 family transposase